MVSALTGVSQLSCISPSECWKAAWNRRRKITWSIANDYYRSTRNTIWSFGSFFWYGKKINSNL